MPAIQLPTSGEIFGGSQTPKVVSRQVGYTPSPEPQAAIQGAERLSGEVAQSARAYGAQGEVMASIGHDIDVLNKQRSEKKSQLDLARAKAYVLQQTTELRTQLSQKPGSTVDDWNKGFNSIAIQAKQLVPLDRDTQEAFNTGLMEINTSGTADIKKQHYDYQSSIMRGQLDTDQDATTKTVAVSIGSGDYSKAAAALDIHGQMIDATAKMGAIAPEDQARLKIDHAQASMTQALRSLQPGQQLKILGPSPSTYGPPAPADKPDMVINHMIDHIEGGYVGRDGKSGAPAIYGINEKANPEAFAEAMRITKNQGETAGKAYAAKFYKESYWDANNIGDLPRSIQSVAFDTYVNHGAGFAKKAITAADGNPAKLIALRSQEYERLARENPDKYAGNLPGWKNRLDQLSAQASVDSGSHLPSGTNHLLNILRPDVLEGIRQEATRSMQVTLSPQIDDAIAEAQRTGSSSQMPPPTDIVTAFGPEKGKILLDKYKSASDYGQKYVALATKTPVEMTNIIKTAEPLPGQEGYADALTNYTQLQTAAANITKERYEDPQKFAMEKKISEGNPIDFKDTENLPTAIAARERTGIDMSQKYGVPMTIFSKDEATAIAKSFETATPLQKLQLINTIKTGTKEMSSYLSAMKQISQSSDSASNAAMAGAYLATPEYFKPEFKPGDVAMTILTGDAAINPPTDFVDGKDSKKKPSIEMPEDKKMLASFMANGGTGFEDHPQTMQDSYKAFNAFYAGLSIKEGDYSGEFNSDRAESAAKAIIGTTWNSQGKTVIAPWGMGGSQFKDALKTVYDDKLNAIGLQDKVGYNFSNMGFTNSENYGEYYVINGAENLKDPTTGKPVTINVFSQTPLRRPVPKEREPVYYRGEIMK